MWNSTWKTRDRYHMSHWLMNCTFLWVLVGPGKVLPNVFWVVARILKSLPYVRPNSDKSEATIPILDLSKTNCKTWPQLTTNGFHLRKYLRKVTNLPIMNAEKKQFPVRIPIATESRQQRRNLQTYFRPKTIPVWTAHTYVAHMRKYTLSIPPLSTLVV